MMAKDLAKKKRIRRGHRTSVTKLIHQVKTVSLRTRHLEAVIVEDDAF